MNTWHATDADLRDYLAGTAAHVVAASLESHLMACADCRSRLASGRSTTQRETERRWAQLTEVLDAPRSSALSRISISTRPLLGAWLVAIGLMLLIPAVPLMITGEGVPVALTALAPLAPMLAVALAYRTTLDPAGELSLATPLDGFRAVAARAVPVALAAVPLGVGLGLLLGLPTGLALAWLLPGLALSAVVLLAGTTRLDPGMVAAGLGGAWAVVVAMPAANRRNASGLVVEWVATPSIQLTALGVAALALLVTVARRDRIAYRRTA